MSNSLIERHPWAVVSIAIAGLAAWMGLGTLHDLQHADSLLTVLISTQRWTPFFWGQDRFGMLVPLLAMPLHHPLANLLAQGWMMTIAALLAPFVMARFLDGRAGAWVAIGAGANLLFLTIATPDVRFDWLVAQPYGLSLSLGFAGLIVADEGDARSRGAIAFMLLALACWVNVGVVVMLAAAAAISGARPLRLLLLSGGGIALASLVARYGTSARTIAALAPPRQWLVGWWQLLAGLPGVTARPAIVITVGIVTVIAAGWLAAARRLPSSRSLLALLAMAALSWLALGTSLWVGMNLYVFRYMYPVLLIAGVATSSMIAALFTGRTAPVSMAALAMLIAFAMVEYGEPSLGRVERGINERFGHQTAAVIHSGATVIAGNYWRVWPAVFHANLALARIHSQTRVFGLTTRSEETDPLWKNATQRVVIAAWPDDQTFQAMADEHGVTAVLITHLPGIDLYAAR